MGAIRHDLISLWKRGEP